MRAEHYPFHDVDDATDEPFVACPSCLDDWPCVLVRLLDALDEAEQRVEEAYDEGHSDGYSEGYGDGEARALDG